MALSTPAALSLPSLRDPRLSRGASCLPVEGASGVSSRFRRPTTLETTTRIRDLAIGRPKAYLGTIESDGALSPLPFENSRNTSKRRQPYGGPPRPRWRVAEGPGFGLRESVRSRAVTCRAGLGAMEEAVFDQGETRSYLRDTPSDWLGSSGGADTAVSRPGSLPLPRFSSDRADNVALHNPLKRLERLGCGWLTVLMEWEGVIVEDDPTLERKSWAMLATEEGKSQPPGFLLRRADGMKNEQAIMEVFCWGREYKAVKRLAQRRDELYGELQGGCYRLLPGAKEFVESLKKYDIPVAIVSTRPRKLLDRAIEAVGMEGVFDLVVSAEDVQRGKPDPEMFQYASMCLQFIPERCIVVGNANSTIEAAHDALMKVVAVAGKHPAYELGAADLVVSRLDNLSMVDLKKLADLDSIEFTPQLELEEEFEEERPQAAVAEL